MKKKLQLLFSIWLLSLSFQSTAQTWNWANSFGSISGVDQVNDIAVDASGNSYVTGSYSGTIQTPVDTITSIGGQNIFTAKFDSTGNIAWLRSAGGSSNNFDSGNAITVDHLGNVYVTGDIFNTVTFDTITINTTANGASSFLAKYDSNGSIQWVRTGVPTAPTFFLFNTALDVAVDDFGNIYVVGQRTDDAVIFGSITLPGTFNNFTFLVKYDPNGNELWAKAPSLNSSPLKIEIYNNHNSP